MKQFFSKKITLKLWQRLLLFCLLCGYIFLVSVYLQPGPIQKTFSNFLHEPRLLLLNFFPVLVFLGVFYALLNNLLFAGAAGILLFHLISLVNLIKVECRKDPLVPGDFGLLGEAMIATGEYVLYLHIPIVVFVVFTAAALIVLGIKFKSRLTLWPRLIAGLLLIALFVGSMFTAYPSADLYKEMVASVEGLSSSNVPAVFDETGFLYCFLHNVNLYAVRRPDNYSASEAARWAAQTAEPVGEPLPVNVIFVQCEAFSDIYDAPAFSYAEEDNPLYLYHRIEQSGQAFSGQIVVSNYGAGTANTEFDVLTGVETNLLNETSPTAFRMIHKKTASLARVFTGLGYRSWFMHPGQSWFYNRDSVYDRLGFPDRTFLDDFHGGYKWKGSRISDEAFGKMLLEHYEAYKAENDAPWFAFTVTIQNHQSYPRTKYKEGVPDAELSIDVSQSALDTLSVYAEGIRDSAILLQRLTAYFDQEAQPTLIIFWGDHLPALGSSFSVYREIGLDIGNENDPEAALDTYSTPFLIYGNKAYCETYDFAGRVQALELPAGNRISDIYLGELVYELLDLQGTDAYFDFLGEIRRALPVICRGRYMLPDGTLTDALSEQDLSLLDKLCCWGYYRVTDERIP